MKFFIPLLVFGALLVFSGTDAAEYACPAIAECDPPCVIDKSGPCPWCDCNNRCSVSCSTPGCKIIREGTGECRCECRS
ncbi:hypothetical protein NPIL_327831 [Nephila pilipes]|uniref:Spider venom protein n=1 Tax=Nephila pilipes TaxID=299642 RepID=A0A8X6USE4_NEPPI|nr:hypothetical protein NPIL_327831 [Nephila pilipes]